MEFGEKRLGNWIVTKYEKDEVPFIRIKPVSSEHSWEYSAFDVMFQLIDTVIDDGKLHDGLQTCIAIMAEFIHQGDPVFYDLYVKCLKVYGDIASVRKPATQEEERAIIEEMKVQYEIDEALRAEEEKAWNDAMKSMDEA